MICEGDILENFLSCKALRERTTADEIFRCVDQYLESANLSWQKCVGICTDGAPAMAGSISGFVSLIKKKNPNVTITYCFIHRETLVAAVLVDK